MIFLTAWLLLPALLLALLIDRWLGEPPAAIHPVVGMGKYLDFCGRYAAPLENSPKQTLHTRLLSRVLGALFWLLGAALVVGMAYALQTLLVLMLLHELLTTAYPYSWAWGMALLLALLLKPLFAWRMLAAEVQAVDAALQISLEAGRERVSRLVSRDTSALSANQVREAAITTLAENFNDSLVAPLFWFCIGGLPAAALYRYANTADACWGYIGVRQGRVWTDAGWLAARADDALSWLPARLSAIIILIAAQAGLAACKPFFMPKNTSLFKLTPRSCQMPFWRCNSWTGMASSTSLPSNTPVICAGRLSAQCSKWPNCAKRSCCTLRKWLEISTIT